MPSTIAWLDADTEDQARMRDIIKLFTDRDSRDELGLGQVRDVISDGLFPGTTVLLTRARYLLFVPWCFQLAEGKPDPLALADKNERQVISTLRKSGSDDLTGLLGARVGQALQTLPSTIYWGTLRRYGIVREEYAWKSDAFGAVSRPEDGDDEGARKRISAWSHSVPPIPPEFPHRIDDAFALSRDEAGWLRERVLEHAPDTVMAHLMNHAPMKDSRSPWTDPAVQGVEGEAALLLRNAEAFSTAMHGAALLYNLQLAEEYERVVPEDRRRFSAPVDQYRGELAEWADRVERARIAQWDVGDLWGWVLDTAKATIAPGSARFISDWVAHIQGIDPRAISDDSAARDLVRERERRQKRALARLGNPKRLSAWSGAAGAGALTFRWDTVRDIALDIHAGLGRDA
ncbi:DUF6361 family protein [Microbacterium limosum]|uniref:DUF6361 family protein n=1 Tax=Microbacterium limosum TaxID=3079935 RepID=A0AAU0MEE4_9MICO|nr:DUF6361 family protein [Microbacterium sp. Y20]WOQ68623.1 DUF6361 family protein [Microbacterium sp. Y20]